MECGLCNKKYIDKPETTFDKQPLLLLFYIYIYLIYIYIYIYI